MFDKCSPTGLDIPKSAYPTVTPLAMAYVPYQSWGTTYPENTALEKGTIFADLDYPFLGKEGVRKYGK